MPKVAVIMGSDSDFPALESMIRILKSFGVEADVRVLSAHRTPEKAAQYAKDAEANGIEVLIAAAGKAAHLAGVLAAHTALPVIGIPMKSSLMDGLDSLLSMVQMPNGIPVATVAVNGGDNAGLLAVQMLSLKYPLLRERMHAYKADMQKGVEAKDEAIRSAAQAL